jgi:uncharacterized protein (TIGR00730 family)
MPDPIIPPAVPSEPIPVEPVVMPPATPLVTPVLSIVADTPTTVPNATVNDWPIIPQSIIEGAAGAAFPSPHDARLEARANTPEAMSREERHHAMGTVLTNAIEEGKHKVPEELNPLITKPNQMESWRVFKIMSEFVEGFDLIRKYSLAATFFGSARETFSGQVYEDCTELAGRLAKAGFAVITGGSAGIMQAANRGAFEAGGASIGLNIRLEDNQSTNKYVTDSMMFDHFFVRKVMLTFASSVYIYFPGGFGTLDEFTEILTLVQTKKIKPVPIVLYDAEYWNPLLELFKVKLLDEYHSIDAADMDLFRVVSTVDEAYSYIISTVKK